MTSDDILSDCLSFLDGLDQAEMFDQACAILCYLCWSFILLPWALHFGPKRILFPVHRNVGISFLMFSIHFFLSSVGRLWLWASGDQRRLDRGVLAVLFTAHGTQLNKAQIHWTRTFLQILAPENMTILPLMHSAGCSIRDSVEFDLVHCFLLERCVESRELCWSRKT